MSEPQIDVVIPAYNAAAYIEKALASVVGQTCRPRHIIVIDDGSKDDTVEVVRRFAAGHPVIPIECISQPNAGVSAARNLGLEHVQAEFVALLDADDVWLPTKLEKQMAVFLEPSGVDIGLVYCNYGWIDELDVWLPDLGYQLDPTMRGHVARRLRRANQIAGSASAVLLRTTILREIGTFDCRLVCAEDWDLWLRIAERYAVDFVPEQLVMLRKHSQNSQNNEARMLSGELLFTDKQLRQFKLPVLNLVRLARRLKNTGVSASNLSSYTQWHFLLKLAMSAVPVFVIYWTIRAGSLAWRIAKRRWLMLMSRE